MALVGKVALVSGAGKGIGKAIANALAANGIKVGVNALHEESAAAATKEIIDAGGQAMALTGDVSEQKMVEVMVSKLVETFGPVDILVNNAAAPAEIMPFEKTTMKEQRDELVTLMGTLNCTRAVLPSMIARRMGRIINISSIAGCHGMPGRAIYSAANGGIDSFTKALAHEVGQYGITVNSISPGATESPRFRARSKEVRDAHQRMIAIPRFAEPEDMANAVLFFAQEESSYITGAILDTDGGFSGYVPFHEKH
jgi:NAD(P)-dependent dehydrogenase (short-subunit alcohol dehydrogenase family)